MLASSVKVQLSTPVVIVFMGVAGSGKTTVAAFLLGRLGWSFEEGDALHSDASIEKMKAGRPLSDEDRAQWLERIADWVDARLDAGENGLITCSALKRSYRDRINHRRREVTFVFLRGSYEEIEARLAIRHGHFMPADLLRSQFNDLEPPEADEPAITVDIGPPPGRLADQIVDRLHLSTRAQ